MIVAHNIMEYGGYDEILKQIGIDPETVDEDELREDPRFIKAVLQKRITASLVEVPDGWYYKVYNYETEGDFVVVSERPIYAARHLSLREARELRAAGAQR